MSQDRFDHLFIAPADFDGTVAFYPDALGWRSIKKNLYDGGWWDSST